jgi:hypothetical protein
MDESLPYSRKRIAMEIKGIVRSSSLAVMAAVLLAANPATANIIYTTSGTTSGGSVAGSADFTIGASTLTLVITNSTSSVGDIAQVLDGLSFTTVGGSGLSLSSVSATGFVDCFAGPTCASSATFREYIGNGSTWNTLSSPYGWGYSSPLLSAGAGSYKPAGIVNSSVFVNAGIPNQQHNDYLLGPVTFDFSFTTAPTNISAATFYWGTGPETTTGTTGGSTGGTTGGTTGGGESSTGGNIPEPATLALLGLGLFAIALASRRRAGAIG